MGLSVIIPACNEEGYIGSTLESIKHDAEVIVVCNGCTDKTFEVASKYAGKNSKLKVFNIPERGVSRARNFGANMATGKKLVFLDADIRLEQDVLGKIENSESALGTCLVKPDVDKFLPKGLMLLKNIAHYFGKCTGLIFCTKGVFDKAGGFDESLAIGEDGKFLRQARKFVRHSVINAYVYNCMRRFEKKGYAHVCFFWIRQLFRPKSNYEIVR